MVGQAPKAPAPLVWRRLKAASMMVDGEIDGSIYGTIYPSIYGSENGAQNKNPSGRIISSSGRIIEGPLVVVKSYAIDFFNLEHLTSCVEQVFSVARWHSVNHHEAHVITDKSARKQ